MADRPEREVRRGGRKGRKKVCSFCVDRAEFIDYKDVAKPPPPCDRHLRVSSARPDCGHQARPSSGAAALHF